ncbi:MAG: type IV pilus secretin PilQ [Acidobacteria bacterium]|nr:type IV pilus secretin PilQ [Acidobacteriota bacterium]
MRNMRNWVVAVALAAATTLAGLGAAPQQPAAPAPAAVEQGLQAFSASPIDVDYQSANLRTVLRQLAEIGGVNLVVDPSVPGDASVDLKLTQVPWYQVMDVVLRSGQLAYELEGPVVRVLTLAAQTSERRARNETAVEGKKVILSDLPTSRFRLSYADAADMAKLLTDLKFQADGRSAIQSEPRTNMLIVQASQADLDQIRELLADLDRPEPQVEIEARVVQTLNTTIRDIGVRWGASGEANSALGNTSNLSFPNNGAVATASNFGDTSVGDLLPNGAAGSAIGLAMGGINGALNIDVALRALETEGALRVISTPRITTQNNMEAEVTQGVEIPYQVVTTTGGITSTSIQFKDAALKLLVTPKITAANTVIMNIALENGTPSDILGAEAAGPSIRTDRARTSVQVADGATTVIGGILATTDQSDRARTPGLSRVPLLGWLFKNEAETSRAQELLIFITPRIIRG